MSRGLAFLLTVGVTAVLLAGATVRAASSSAPLRVFAASSLTESLQNVADAWARTGGRKVVLSFDSSSRLAAQIEAGAPVDAFFSADTDWMTHVEKAGRIEPGSRRDLLSNRIVVIVPADGKTKVDAPTALTEPWVRRLALAGENVPAGKYARAELKKAGVLEKLRERTVNGDNVRAALQWVARNEADAGIVFRTDARIEPKVRVVYEFPEDPALPIRYPAAVVRGSKSPESARKFLEFCQGREAREIFRKAGFL